MSHPRPFSSHAYDQVCLWQSPFLVRAFHPLSTHTIAIFSRKNFGLATSAHIVLFPHLLYPFNQVRDKDSNRTTNESSLLFAAFDRCLKEKSTSKKPPSKKCVCVWSTRKASRRHLIPFCYWGGSKELVRISGTNLTSLLCGIVREKCPLLFNLLRLASSQMAISGSIFMTVAIAWERYIAVHYPLDYNQAMNDTNAVRKRVRTNTEDILPK